MEKKEDREGEKGEERGDMKGKEGSGMEKLGERKGREEEGERGMGRWDLGKKWGGRLYLFHLHRFSVGDHCCSPRPYGSPSSG